MLCYSYSVSINQKRFCWLSYNQLQQSLLFFQQESMWTPNRFDLLKYVNKKYQKGCTTRYTDQSYPTVLCNSISPSSWNANDKFRVKKEDLKKSLLQSNEWVFLKRQIVVNRDFETERLMWFSIKNVTKHLPSGFLTRSVYLEIERCHVLEKQNIWLIKTLFKFQI